ncbi:hypothetical protein FB107DRAFT_267736 [Schizophyllum commune]
MSYSCLLFRCHSLRHRRVGSAGFLRLLFYTVFNLAFAATTLASRNSKLECGEDGSPTTGTGIHCSFPARGYSSHTLSLYPSHPHLRPRPFDARLHNPSPCFSIHSHP